VSRRFARATDDAWCSLERESCRERVRGRLLESGGRSSFFFFSKQHFVLVLDVFSHRMSKPGPVRAAVKNSTRELPAEEFVQRVTEVPTGGGADAGVCAPVDLNAWAFFQLLLVVGALLRAARENCYEVTTALVVQVLEKHGSALLAELSKIKDLTDILRSAYRAKGSPLMLKFLVEYREENDTKTGKYPRDATRPDLWASAMELLGWLDRKRTNLKGIGNAWRKISRAPCGEIWLALSVIVLHTGVTKIFGRSGACFVLFRRKCATDSICRFFRLHRQRRRDAVASCPHCHAILVRW
jgi:hypothetical protein